MRECIIRVGVAALALWGACGGAAGRDGLRIATWNITNYAGGRVSDLQTAAYGQFAGRRLDPDVIMVQEIASASALGALVSALNTAPGSPGDWAAAPFAVAPGSQYDNGIVYRTGRVSFLGRTLVLEGGLAPLPPRNVTRFDIRPAGYAAESATLSLYPSHMKSGGGATDRDRRILEAQTVRGNIATLPAGRHAVFAGDTNITSAFGSDYQALVGAGAGVLVDPIKSPGSWQNSFSFRFIHSQDPSGGGGMDDRFDQILLTPGLLDDQGLDYVGDHTVAFSTTTWDDANHSYRTWGNDGTSFNTTLTVAGNQMVGASIAQALVNIGSGLGHLPVFLDMALPAKIFLSDEVLDFGVVAAGSMPSGVFEVLHDGDVARWGVAGLDVLDASVTTTPNVSVDVSSFSLGAGAVRAVEVTLDTAGAGAGDVVEGLVTVTSDDPDRPSESVVVRATIEDAPACVADVTGDGEVDSGDLSVFVAAFLSGDAGVADVSGDGEVDSGDLSVFIVAFLAGC
jgi:hypothetical protein